jgi:Flp pilus assembly protein TadD
MSVSLRGVRGSLLLAAGTVFATGAQAQSGRPVHFPAGAVVQSLVPDGGAELRRHLTTLADNPRNLDALIGAGRAAIDGGDSQAALTFFSRAAEVAPRDPRVKAGMGSVLVRMERGRPALNLFAEAVALGAPVVEIAGDRGLAYDMVGDPRRAQQDYALVLQRREDPEIRRRLALSLAISGERDAALRVIDGQLRRNDRAAWRTQAFILALTGDWAGANRTAHGMMSPAQAEAITAFFARLPSLTPGQKAMAAHFGRFPANGGTAAASQSRPGADPGALALAAGGPAIRPRTAPADPAAGATRRRPGSSQAAAPPSERPIQPSRATQAPASSIVASSAAAVRTPAPTSQPLTPFARPASSIPLTPSARASEGAPPAGRTGGLSDIAALVAELPEDQARAARTPAATRSDAARPTASTAAGNRASASRAPTTRAAPAHPSRHWVQIAGGANAAALPRELARLRGQAPELADRNAWVAPANATNRLLVGPFASPAEARAFVNTLARRNVTSFAWTSSAGQEIARLRSGR